MKGTQKPGPTLSLVLQSLRAQTHRGDFSPVRSAIRLSRGNEPAAEYCQRAGSRPSRSPLAIVKPAALRLFYSSLHRRLFSSPAPWEEGGPEPSFAESEKERESLSRPLLPPPPRLPMRARNEEVRYTGARAQRP